MKISRLSLWIVGIVFAGWVLFFAARLGAVASRGSSVELTPPTIVDFQPPANSHSAAATTGLTVIYDQPIDPATVNATTFPVQATQSGPATGPYTVIGGRAIFQPDNRFWPGELVQATVTTETLNLTGEPLQQPRVWQFWSAVDWGTGLFDDTGQQLGAGSTWFAGLGDLDGDGDLDAFLAKGLGNQPNEVWFNDGNGQFSDSGQRLGSNDSRGGALGDMDGDGDLDAVVANWNGQYNRVWLNDGLGFFTAGQQFDNRDGTAVGLGDLDGDGDLDVFSVNGSDQTDTVWLNDGSGHLTFGGPILDDDAGRQVRLTDLDGDGDLDAFVANRGPNRVWLNNGRGQFVSNGQALGNDRSEGLDLGDVDGDGDLDAFVANAADPAPSQLGNQIWLNDGLGYFTDSGQSLGNVSSQSVALGDIDADGDLDAVVGNAVIPAQVWLNNGQGIFSDSGQALSAGDSRAVGLADLDGDGDLDLFVGKLNNLPNQVWLNFSEPVSGLAAANDSPTIAGETTHLTATITGGTEVNYTWDLGDGSRAGGPLLSHVYPAAGLYTAVVTASNNLNQQVATTAVTVQVDADILLPVVILPLQVDLALNLIDSPDPVIAGGQLTYSLTVQNLGLSAAGEVQIVDTLPDGVVYNAAASSPLCQHLAGLVTCDLGSLAGGSSRAVLIVVDVELAAVPQVTNQATVASQQPDGWPDNNSAVQETTVLPP